MEGMLRDKTAGGILKFTSFELVINPYVKREEIVGKNRNIRKKRITDTREVRKRGQDIRKGIMFRERLATKEEEPMKKNI